MGGSSDRDGGSCNGLVKFIVAILFILLLIFVFMVLWNWVMPECTTICKPIGYWRALALMVLLVAAGSLFNLVHFGSDQYCRRSRRRSSRSSCSTTC